jgi:hypothetical protein
MNVSLEYAGATVIVLVLLGLAGYFGRKQVQTLRGLRGRDNDTPEERRYQRNQAWLRLVSCGLMVVLAGLLAWTYLTGQERHATELGEMRQANVELSAEQRGAARQWFAYWVAMTGVLFLIMALAVVDLLTIRRFGLKQYRKIQDDRRAMIERQLALLRSRRNGHGE